MTFPLFSLQLKSGDDVEVIVQLVSADYILAAVPDRAIPVAYIVAREVDAISYCCLTLRIDHIYKTYGF